MIVEECLRIPEVLRLIYDELDKRTSLSLALTCKAFLEPGLDRIWRNITSFKPLIGCIPEDIWKPDVISVPKRWGFNIFMVCGHFNFQQRSLTKKFQSPRRDLTSQDLRRYLRYYAPRIRQFSPYLHTRMRMLSIEALQALQIATEYQAGALAPRLQEFHWYRPQQCILALGEPFARVLAPFMSMFLGKSLVSLTVDVDASDPPVYISSVRLAMKQLPLLRSLNLGLAGFSEGWTQPSLWNVGGLERIKVGNIPIGVIPHLASLPNLTSLEVNGIQVQSPAPPIAPNPTGFASLTKLEGCSDSPSDIKHILQHLAPHNDLNAVEWSHSLSTSVSDYQETIDAIAQYCSPSLRQLDLFGIDAVDEERLDFDAEEPIDISPLFQFAHLRELDINIAESVPVTPEFLAQVPDAWPHINRLVLCPTVPSSQTPLIDHSHIFELARKTPSLRTLGLRFDSTRITGQETVAVADSPQLRKLIVGESPICSPSRVSTFFKSGFPYLKALDNCYKSTLERRNISTKRWAAVHEALRS
jgi:hypothetical protein